MKHNQFLSFTILGGAPFPEVLQIYGARVGHVSDIKLIRTDTTLDLSQKAEKRYPQWVCSSDQTLVNSKHDDGEKLCI